MSKKNIRRAIIIGVMILALIIWHSIGRKPPQKGMSPMVVVQSPKVQDVESYYEFTGNAEAIEQVDIKARVEGFLTSVDFVDGADVEQGELLFTIEPNSYQAKRDSAQAQLLASQAELQRAQLDYERIEKAIRANAVSKQELTTKKADRDKAEAQVMAAAAELKNAELNLSYTRIVSPLAGRVSRRFVTPGNLVGAGEMTLLATVEKIQPLYIYFNISEDILSRDFPVYNPGKNEKPKFQVGLAGQEDYPYEGFLDYIDNKVVQSTGTILVRGQIPNADRKLLPGAFVRIRVPTGIKKDALLISERAVGSDLGGKFVLAVDANNIVQNRPVQLGQKVGDKIVVLSGLSKDDRYIISGLHLARPGSPVNPQTEGAPAPVMPAGKPSRK
jgi:RND family efflux transporter MFP subunit